MSTGDAMSYWLVASWGIGIIVLGLIFVWAIRKSGMLRPAERARLDRETDITRREEEAAEARGPDRR